MKTMKAKNKIPNITLISYPVYISPIMSDKKFTYIPNQGMYINGYKTELIRFNKLKGIQEYTLEGYLVKNKLFLHDCLFINNWINNKGKVTYYSRWKMLKLLVNNCLAEYDKFVTVPTDVAENPGDLIRFYKQYLTEGYIGVNIKNENGYYTFDETTDDFIELTKREENE